MADSNGAIAVALAWLGTSLFDVATYAADARAMALPLVTPGGGTAQHDWHHLLGELGALHLDGLVATVFRALATASMALGLGLGGWLIGRMLRRTTLANRVDPTFPAA